MKFESPKILDALLGRRCPCCGKRALDRRSQGYTRGRDETSAAAAVDFGYWCNNCHNITWAQSMESWKAKIPSWIRPYEGEFYERTFGWNPVTGAKATSKPGTPDNQATL